MADKDDITKRAALRLLNNGRLTIAEVARASGMSRQLVRYWAQEAGIDTSHAHQKKFKQEYIKKVWEREIFRLSDVGR